MVKISDLPVVVDKKRTQTLGGQKTGRRTTDLQVDMSKQSLSDLREMTIAITLEESARQEFVNNVPSFLAVDNQPGKSLDNLKYKSVVGFGSVILEGLIRAVEIELSKAIRRNTTSSGRFADIHSYWHWEMSDEKGAPWRPLNPRSLKALTGTQRIALVANDDVIDDINFVNSGIRRGNNRREGAIAQTAQKLKRSRLFKVQFSVYGVAGKGQIPMIIIRPRRSKARIRRRSAKI